MAKLARERALQEKRERKREKKEARKQAKAAGTEAEELASADPAELLEDETP